MNLYCKKCIHNCICSLLEEEFGENILEQDDECRFFKDEDNIIELPYTIARKKDVEEDE